MFAACGDCPTFRYLMDIWLRSVLHDEPGTGWCAEFFPLPGGFHLEKQAIWPLVKLLMAGTGMEEFLQDSGLSPYYQENFSKMGHARRNRRFFTELAAASMIRASEVALVELPEFAEAISNSFQENEEQVVALPEGCSLILHDEGPVISSVLRIGIILYQALQTLAKR